jgi:hypothetical protein
MDREEITLTITDITKQEKVNNWKEQVRKLLNGEGLDLLLQKGRKGGISSCTGNDIV